MDGNINGWKDEQKFSCMYVIEGRERDRQTDRQKNRERGEWIYAWINGYQIKC